MIRPQYFILVIGCFILITILLVSYILVYMYLKNRRSKKHKKWAHMAELLIRKAIFSEEHNGHIPTTTRLQKAMDQNAFRQLITEELLKAKKNVTGSAAVNVKTLYLQLGLDQNALEKLKSYQWHIKAQAIQELAIMGLDEHITKLYRFTNNANELVRIEAQLAIVNFLGFEGLRFLDVVTYPINEWQQINLLKKLSNIAPDNFSGIEKWLRSPNKTVVVFALKLVRNYHRFELHDAVAECLGDEDPAVKLQAIITLGEIYDAQTPALLMDVFRRSDIDHQKAILKVFQSIGSVDELSFLLDLLDNDNVEIILHAARALVKIRPEGVEALFNHPSATQYPLNQIIAQVKNESGL